MNCCAYKTLCHAQAQRGHKPFDDVLCRLVGKGQDKYILRSRPVVKKIFNPRKKGGCFSSASPSQNNQCMRRRRFDSFFLRVIQSIVQSPACLMRSYIMPRMHLRSSSATRDHLTPFVVHPLPCRNILDTVVITRCCDSSSHM